MAHRHATRLPPIAALALALVVSACEGDGSGGAAPTIVFQSTSECLVFAGGFPSGFASLPGRIMVVTSWPAANNASTR